MEVPARRGASAFKCGCRFLLVQAIFRGELSLAAADAEAAAARAAAAAVETEQRAKDELLAKEEGVAQQAAAAWYESHFLDPDGRRAAATVLDNAVQNRGAAAETVGVLFAMFGAWGRPARATALPARFLDELLHAVDPVSAAGRRQRRRWRGGGGGGEREATATATAMAAPHVGQRDAQTPRAGTATVSQTQIHAPRSGSLVVAGRSEPVLGGVSSRRTGCRAPPG